jgi:hypothetical protein
MMDDWWKEYMMDDWYANLLNESGLNANESLVQELTASYSQDDFTMYCGVKLKYVHAYLTGAEEQTQ